MLACNNMKIIKILSLLLIFTVHSCISENQSLPDILIIVTDDQRYDDLDEFMPITKKEIFDKGIRFNSAYVTTPACCPSRSSIMTGLYTSQHAVRGNRYTLNKTTFFEQLSKDKKYLTGLVGKYLNSWNGEKREEFNYWASFEYGSVKYKNPRINENGEWKIKNGYITYILRDYALDFLNQAVKEKKPYSLLLAFNAPHFESKPHKDDIGRFKNSKPRINPNFNEADRSDKPSHIKNKKGFSKEKIKKTLRTAQRERECLWSVDKSIGSILEFLKKNKRLDNTLVIFLSDNGIQGGEHALTSKYVPYEASVKVPFAVRFDGKITPRISDSLVANIDIAPTVYELTKTKKPAYDFPGYSLSKLFKKDIKTRDGILLENFFTQKLISRFAAYHTGKSVYIRNESTTDRNNFEEEFYDLQKDPYQLDNIISDPRVNTHRKELEKLLMRYRKGLSFDLPKGTLAEGMESKGS